MNNALFKLHKIAEKENIPIHYLDMNQDGVSVCENKKYIIGLNLKIKSEIKEKNTLAHELGHCKTGALYYLNDFTNILYNSNVKWAENKAKAWEYKQLYPIKELKQKIKQANNDYELAELYDTDIKTILDVIKYYKEKGML